MAQILVTRNRVFFYLYYTAKIYSDEWFYHEIYRNGLHVVHTLNQAQVPPLVMSYD